MVVSGEGIDQLNFNKLLALNTSAAYLWNSVVGKEFDAETLATLLTQEYEIDYAQALLDATSLVERWTECGLIE